MRQTWKQEVRDGGYAAAILGKPCIPSSALKPDLQAAWIRGWKEGQRDADAGYYKMASGWVGANDPLR